MDKRISKLTAVFFSCLSRPAAFRLLLLTLFLPLRTMIKFFFLNFSLFVRPPACPSCSNFESLRPSRMCVMRSILLLLPVFMPAPEETSVWGQRKRFIISVLFISCEEWCCTRSFSGSVEPISGFKHYYIKLLRSSRLRVIKEDFKVW